MSSSVVGALRVVLGADTAAFEKGLSGAQKTLKKFSRDMEKIGAGFTKVGQNLTLGLTLPIAAFGLASVKAAQESADAFGQVEAALKSMGGASGKTSEQLQASAKALQNMAAIDDDEILRNVTANLLTFGKIAGPTFDRAQVAIVDLATRMKMELQPATILIGKALNDPIKGMTAMGRAGIQFSNDQKAAIAAMVKTGDVAGAQAIILGELERQFGGAAKAAADANPYRKLQVALGELSETVGGQLAPALLPLVTGLTDLAKRFDSLSPAAQKFAVIGGIIAAAIGPVIIVIGSLITAVSAIAAFMAGPAAAAFAAFAAAVAGPALVALGAFLVPLLPIIAGVAALAAAFFIFRDQITPVLVRVGGVIDGVFGPKVKELIGAFGAVIAALGDNLAKSAHLIVLALAAAGDGIAKIFAPGGKPAAVLAFFGEAATRLFDGLVYTITGALDLATNIFNAFASLLKGDWSAMWGYLGKAVVAVGMVVVNVFKTLFPEVIGWVKKTWEGVKLWLVDKFSTIVKAVGEKVAAVAGFFKALWDAVVGHSYVPDMVKGIAAWMAKLDEGMVNPARGATEKTADAFRDLRDDIAQIMDGLLSDQERAARDLAKITATIAKGKKEGVLSPDEAREAQQRAEIKYGVGPYGPSRSKAPLPANDAPQRQRQRTDPEAAARHNVGSAPTVMWGGQVFSPEALTDLRDQFIGFGKSFTMALKEGDLPGFFEGLAMRFADKLLDQALSKIFDAIGSAGGGQGGGGIGAIFSAIFGGGGGGSSIPGFATGGSFTVGGSGGIDSKLVQFRATPGEMVNITHGNDNGGGGGGGTNIFDMRGAVVTQDLLQQMDSIAARGDAQVLGRVAKASADQAKASRYRVAR